MDHKTTLEKQSRNNLRVSSETKTPSTWELVFTSDFGICMNCVLFTDTGWPLPGQFHHLNRTWTQAQAEAARETKNEEREMGRDEKKW